MQTMNIDEAKIHLIDLMEAAAAGEAVFIRKDEELSVQLVPCVVKKGKRHFGSAKGLISMSTDFDEPLMDFKEYRE